MAGQPPEPAPASPAGETTGTRAPVNAPVNVVGGGAAPAPFGGVSFVDRSAPPLRFNTVGDIDGLIGMSVLGWAYDRDYGRRRVKVTLFVNDQLVLETTANGLRRELVGIGGHDGFSGFICAIPPERFSPGASIRIFGDGTELTAAPLLLGPAHCDGIVEPIAGAVATGWVRERVREPTRALIDLLVDGKVERSFTADRLRAELKTYGIDDGCFGFAEALPDCCLDGGEHVIEFRHRNSGGLLSPGAQRFRASFRGVLERLDQYGGGGWVFCHEARDRPVALDIVVNGERVGVAADRSRGDVRAVHGVEHCGFEFRVPETTSRHHEIAVEVMVAGTNNPVMPGPFTFTPVSRVIEELEAIAAKVAEDEGPAGGPTYSAIREAIIPNILAALRAHERRTGPLDLSLRVDLSQFQSPAAAVSDIVDVVIPVYNGYDETIACIEAASRAANKTRREIVVVDDVGPDPKLRAALRDYETSGAITLVVNPANLGFPGAANAGMALHPDRDVILLNSDTLVPDGWIDRLRAAAYRGGNVGSVTPLSNRATICSYPEINKDNDLPGDIAWEGLDAICAEVNDGRAIEIPTAVGFCAYLRRAMLREVGLLNTERWKKGYGEENELCILAAARGWKHVLAPNLFVVHHGAVSFGVDGRRALLESNLGTLNRLYPDYFPRVMEFLRQDPVAAARRAIDWARLKQLSPHFMLHVSHQNGGGTNVHVEDMVRRLAALGEEALILEANADNRGFATVRNLTLGTKSVYALPADGDALVADLRGCGVWHIHFHQVMGGARWAALPAQLGCAYDVTAHDYSFFCPRIDLIDEAGRYCGEPAVEVCERCVSLNLPHPDLRGPYRDRGGTMAAWLGLHRRLLAGARRIFTPSADTAARMERHLPGIAYTARRHPEPVRRVAIRRPASAALARIAVIGAIGTNKGSELLVACAREALKQGLPIQFRLFGYAADDAALRRLANVHVSGEYRRADLPRLLAEHPCDAALFLGIWPETYCYALSDAYSVGLFPIALDFGAVGERIAASRVGALLPAGSTPAEINAAIIAAIARFPDWPESIEIGEESEDILADYYELRPPAADSPPATPRKARRRNRS
ncbi:MAG TPA: glycosyltransferase [Stellaceae bacterium]|nr:glycosyltransferase [Stellaceae bacterium]